MSIYAKVLAFIATPRAHGFEPLALDVFRYQFNSVAPYREYCLSLKATPDNIRSVAQVPAISTVAFKYARLENQADAALPGACVFLTSGTTLGRDERGRHLVPRPESYRASALAHLRQMLFPDGMKLAMLALHPTADRMPESSLARMISWCMEEFGAGPALCAASREAVDAQSALRFLADCEGKRRPVCVLGTTASFGALFSYCESQRSRLRLAPGSRMMDTGGAKGQVVPLGIEEVCARARDLLGVDPALVINEYGMTELCSQLYDATRFNARCDDLPAAERFKIAPPWLDVSAVDPVSLQPVRAGKLGMLRFFDLANVGSVSAVLSEDFGIVDGERVRIVGRASGGVPRGCALGVEQFERFESSAHKAMMTAARAVPADHLVAASAVPSPAEMDDLIARVRSAARDFRGSAWAAEILGRVFTCWRDHSFPLRRQTVSRIASRSAISPALLEASIDALLAPFTHDALTRLAATLKARPPVTGGFVMPANVPGAGLHELALALLAGATAIVKLSSREPHFFAALAHTIREADPGFGSRLATIVFGRDDRALADRMTRACDFIVALGDDATVASLNGRAHLFGFGSKTSGALVSLAPTPGYRALAAALARDVTLFEQRGCLSLNHLFVEDHSGKALDAFAGALASALDALAKELPPAAFTLNDAAAIRRVRESARWRAIAGHGVQLWEGAQMGWTVVLDPQACFMVSPGYRTVCVSPVRNVADLKSRLAPVAGRLEAFALVTPGAGRAVYLEALTSAGVSYVCEPGQMQSPPLTWRHGGGGFLDFVCAAGQAA